MWQTKTVKQYERLNHFWATEWWWLNLLNVPFLLKSFQQDLGEIFQEIRNSERLSDLLQVAKQLPKQLLENFEDLVRDDQLFGFVARSQTNPNEIFVVLRGTREFAEWFNNFRPVHKRFLEDRTFGDLGDVRNGFNRIYSKKHEENNPEKATIEETIVNLFEERQDLLTDKSEIFITGHSLGAGLATLAAIHISKIAENRGITPTIKLYTFASPRVGDERFAENFDSIRCYRIVNSEDLIQSVPLPTTQVVNKEILDEMSPARKARTLWVRGMLETITNGQAAKRYQHIGIPITFTKQTGTIAGNHNLAETYREALRDKANED